MIISPALTVNGAVFTSTIGSGNVVLLMWWVGLPLLQIRSHTHSTATPTYLHHSIVQDPRDKADVATDLVTIKHDTIFASSLASSSTVKSGRGC